MDWWTGYRGVPGWTFGALPPHYMDEWDAGRRTYSLLAGIGWKMLLDTSDDCEAALPAGSWLEIRYEDILSNPHEQFSRMLEFMTVPADRGFDRMLTSFGFSSAREAAFRHDLDGPALAALDVSLGEHLAARGYVL